MVGRRWWGGNRRWWAAADGGGQQPTMVGRQPAVDVDDDVPLAPIKRSKKHHIKIRARNRLFRVFDEEEYEDEGENKKPWELDDEVANEDETDEENEVDDEDEWP
nr:concanavalin A-like lectin/glucanase domain-containing protein [Tanacetum cinerariifolium]